MPPPSDTDQQRAQVDFWSVWLAHYAYIKRYACRLVADPHDADDLLGEALIKAQRAFVSADGEIQHPRAWLRTVVRTRWIDQHHQETCRRWERADAAFGLDERTDPGPEPFYVAQEIDRIARSQLDRLSPMLREAWELRHRRHLGYRQIAETQQITEATARKRVQLARAAMRKLLAMAT